VIDMAREFAKHDIQVTLAPFLQELRAMNFYQSPGWGAPLTTAEGFHGKLLNIDVSNDWTITHISIDKSEKIHARIAREVLALAHR
jgi:hypothetical protein